MTPNYHGTKRTQGRIIHDILVTLEANPDGLSRYRTSQYVGLNFPHYKDLEELLIACNGLEIKDNKVYLTPTGSHALKLLRLYLKIIGAESL